MNEQLLRQYQGIQKIKTDLLNKIKTVDEEQLNKKPADGSWSLGQVYYHCYLAENGTIKTIEKNLKENKVKLQSEFADKIRNILLLIVLKSPLKFKAPAVVQKVPEHITYNEIEELYADSTNDFNKILASLPASLIDKRIFKHPIAGLFNIEQTLNFVGEHYKHHIMQIDRLL